MNEPIPDWKSFTFWGKTAVQGIVLYNSLYHRSVDPSLGIIVVGAMEAVYHAGQSLVHAARALKGVLTPPAAPPAPAPTTPALPPAA